MNLSEAFVGDEYVDLIGLSYYNRSGAEGYNKDWTPVGAALRGFYRAVEDMTSRNIWICETGCNTSNSGYDKGQWYADLIRRRVQ
jgi:beta-mannanase